MVFLDDEILDYVLDIFDNKVGETYSEEILTQIMTKAEERYENKIPLGYKDNGKTNNNKYGDYIIWIQMMEYSKSENKSLIFVTHDQKEDWWERVNGKTIGPRNELREEFEKETDNIFHMYTINQFLKFNDKEKLDEKVISEVNKVSKEYYYNNKNKINNLQSNMIKLEKDIEKRKQNVNMLLYKYLNKPMPKPIEEQVNNTQKNINQKRYELKKLYEKIKGELAK